MPEYTATFSTATLLYFSAFISAGLGIYCKKRTIIDCDKLAKSLAITLFIMGTFTLIKGFLIFFS